jgi:hypothetical protein
MHRCSQSETIRNYVAKLSGFLQGIISGLKYPFGILKEHPANSGQGQGSAVSVDELHAELLFQRGDLLAEGRLGFMQRIRGFAEVEVSCKHHKGSKFSKFHFLGLLHYMIYPIEVLY